MEHFRAIPLLLDRQVIIVEKLINLLKFQFLFQIYQYIGEGNYETRPRIYGRTNDQSGCTGR
jgi:hypothetical protein